jgi:hypothetical protein
VASRKIVEKPLQQKGLPKKTAFWMKLLLGGLCLKARWFEQCPQVRFLVDGFQLGQVHVGTNFRRGDILMAKHLLDYPKSQPPVSKWD